MAAQARAKNLTMHARNTHKPARHAEPMGKTFSGRLPKRSVPGSLVSPAINVEVKGKMVITESLPWWDAMDVADEMLDKEDLNVVEKLEQREGTNLQEGS